jgi:predicted nucleic acid-binding protein
MLYVDSSVLVKRYLDEPGSEVLRARLRRGDKIYTSALSYAEVLSVFGRRFRERLNSEAEFEMLHDCLRTDWFSLWNVLEVNAQVMASVHDLVKQHPIKSADAVHLSAALWLRSESRPHPEPSGSEIEVEFGVADKALARIAAQCGLAVFNPETRAT